MSYAVNPSPAEARGAPPALPFPLPPTFPPGVDPVTYRIGTVERILKDAAFLPVFSRPDPRVPNVAFTLPGRPDRLTGIEVHESLHYLELQERRRSDDRGLAANKVVGQRVGSVGIEWRVIPDDYVAAPGREPPPTVLDPRRSQRFVMMNGRFELLDRDRSGFHGFGAGRTFPVVVGGQPRLRIGAVVEVLEGFGKLAGKKGNVVVNGYITPPDGLALGLMVRIMDPSRDLLRSASPEVLPETDPDPDSVFLVLRGEVDPDRPVTLNKSPEGKITGSNLFERLRLVHFDFKVAGSRGLRAWADDGPIVGRLGVTTLFDLFSPAEPVPFQTTNSEFLFFDKNESPIGTFRANIIEGRAFRTPVSGAPMPILRLGGFGPLIEGTRQFADLDGMLSMVSAISVFPRTLDMLYILRVIDPDGRFRDACHAAWS